MTEVAGPPPTAPATTGQPLSSFLLVGGSVFTVTMLAFFRVPLLPSIGADLDMSASTLGLATATYAVGRLATDLPAGRLVDRLAEGQLLVIGTTVIGLGSLLIAIAPASWVVFAALAVLGVGTALTNTTGATFFATAGPARRRGTAVSGFSAAQLGGQSFGPAIAGLLADAFGSWRGAEGVAVGLAVAMTLMTASAWRRFPTVELAHKSHSRTTETGLTPLHQFALFLVPFVMFLTVGALIQTVVPLVGDGELNMSATAIGLAAGLGGVCRFAGAILGGLVADRFARKAALVPGLILQAAGVFLLAIGDTRASLLIAIALLSFGGVGTSIGIAILADLSPRGALGRNLGRFRFAGDLGLITGPAATAWLYDHYGRATAVFPVVVVIVFCAVIVTLFVPETRHLAHDPVAPS